MIEKHGEKAERGVFLAIGGSGAQTLMKQFALAQWAKELRKIIKAHDVGTLTPQGVAAYFARLNHRVHLLTGDKTVGDRCVVAWRLKDGGGAQELFAGTSREISTEWVTWPTISNGQDMNALLAVFRPHMFETFAAHRRGETAPELDKDAIGAQLAKLPETPDESLD